MDKYGLIGFPLGHSFSISFFNQKFQDEDIDAVYENFEIPNIDQLDEILGSNPNLKGLWKRNGIRRHLSLERVERQKPSITA